MYYNRQVHSMLYDTYLEKQIYLCSIHKYLMDKCINIKLREWCICKTALGIRKFEFVKKNVQI